MYVVLARRYGVRELTLCATTLISRRAEPMWRGRLRVIEQGSGIPSKCAVRMEDANSGTRTGAVS